MMLDVDILTGREPDVEKPDLLQHRSIKNMQAADHVVYNIHEVKLSQVILVIAVGQAHAVGAECGKVAYAAMYCRWPAGRESTVLPPDLRFHKRPG